MVGVTESEPIIERDGVVEGDERHRLPSASAEKRIVEALEQVSDCVVVAARLEGRLRTDVLLMLRADADSAADYEPAVRAALGGDEARSVRRVFVVGVDRDFPEGLTGLGESGSAGTGSGGSGSAGSGSGGSGSAGSGSGGSGSWSAGDREALARWHFAELLGARLPGLGAGAEQVPVAAERVRVDFAGEGSGVAELSWGQREIWQAMTRQGNWLPLGGSKPLDPGTTVADVAEELAFLHGRFPSMRTRLRFDEQARPYQVLVSEGWTELEVFDADAGPEAADRLAAAIEAHYSRAPYDMRFEWPVRMAVVRQAGVATRMVVIMHHLALDGGGAETMIRDVAARTTAPPNGLQQLELAEWQYSEAGRRHNDRAMRHFGELLRAMPVPTFPPSPDPRRPPWWSAEFESPALRSASALLAERTGADQARVMMAFYAIALARVTGVNPVLLRPVIGNRFRRHLADIVCHASQAGLVLLDTSDGTVEDVINRAGPAAMNAIKHSYYNPERLDELVRQIGRERGADLDIASFINDRRVALATPETISARTPEEFAAARAGSGFRWSGQRNDPVERMFLHIDDAPGAMRLSIEADTRALAPEQIERLAWTIEDVAVAAALGAGLDSGVRGVRGAGP